MRLADLGILAAGLLRRATVKAVAADASPNQPRAHRPISPSAGLIEALAALGRDERRRVPPVPTFESGQLLRLPEPAPGVVPADRPSHMPIMAQDDSISNFMAAMGAGNFISQSGLGWLGYPFLSELAQRQEYRLISQVFAEEMTREWVDIEITENKNDKKKKGKVEEIIGDFKKFNIRNHFHENIMLDGLMGIGHLYVDIEGARDDKEVLKTNMIVDKKTIKQHGFRGLVRVEPVWTYPATYNSTDPLRGDFFRPQSWWVMGKEVHRTRMLSFVFREMPDLLKPVYMFGGISMTQLCMPAVQNWLETRSSVNNLIDAFSTMAFATNFGTLLAPDVNQALINRVMMFNNMRNNRGSFVYDKDTEDLKNISAPLGGLSDLQAQALEHIPVAARQPLVKYTGMQPAGLNASSDGEIRTFYDTMKALQEYVMMPAVDTILKLIQLNRYGDIDEDIRAVPKGLWQLDEAGKAATEKEEADTMEVLYNMGAVDGSEVREAVSMKPSGLFQGVDLSKPLPEPDLGDPADPVSDPISQSVGRRAVEAGGYGGSGANSGV